MKKRYSLVLVLSCIINIGLIPRINCQNQSTVVGGVITAEITLNINQIDVIRVAWNESNVYALLGPDPYNTTAIEYLDPYGQPIMNTMGAIGSEVDLPGGQVSHFIIIWNADHIFALLGPVGGITTAIEYLDPMGQSIKKTRGVINSKVNLSEGWWGHTRVVWTDDHVYSLAGPVGGITSSSEYLDPSGIPISNTMGVITSEIFLADQVVSFTRVAWNSDHVYALIGPHGAITSSKEYMDPLGFSIPGVNGIINSWVNLPGSNFEPTRIAWNDDHVFALAGPVGGVTSSVEYLDPSGQPIPSIRGVVNSEVELPAGGIEFTRVAWNDKHIFALAGPVGGITSSIEFLDPGGLSIVNTRGIINSRVNLVGKNERILVTWNDDHIWAINGPVAGVTSAMEYLDTDGQSITNTRGVVTRETNLLGGDTEDIRVAWTDSRVYGLTGPSGGIVSTTEFLDPQGLPLENIEGIAYGNPVDQINLAWNDDHVYAITGPTGGVTTTIEYFDPEGLPFTKTRGIITSEVWWGGGFMVAPVGRTDEKIFALMGPDLNGQTWTIEYLDPHKQSIATNGNNIQSFVQYTAPFRWMSGAGLVGNPSVDVFLVDAPLGSVKVSSTPGYDEATMVGGSESIFLIGNPTMTIMEKKDLSGFGSMILLESPTTGLVESLAAQSDRLSLQCLPNPFSVYTSIGYVLPEDNWIELSIYNIQGQRVRTLVNREEVAGYYTIAWYGQDQQGGDLPGGVYYIHLRAFHQGVVSKKIVLVK